MHALQRSTRSTRGRAIFNACLSCPEAVGLLGEQDFRDLCAYSRELLTLPSGGAAVKEAIKRRRLGK